jgi:hypothetical protein
MPPAIDLLWTPGYWGWNGGVFVFSVGFWGPTVGFYGGINYGFGYSGFGYDGGYWRGNTFYYDTTVNNFGTTRINAVYTRNVVTSRTITRTSFNGGPGGVVARPNAAQVAASRQAHLAPTPRQTSHTQLASQNPASRAGTSRGMQVAHASARSGAAGAATSHASSHRAGATMGHAYASAGRASSHNFAQASYGRTQFHGEASGHAQFGPSGPRGPQAMHAGAGFGAAPQGAGGRAPSGGGHQASAGRQGGRPG